MLPQFVCVSGEIMRKYTNSSRKASFPAVWAGLSEEQQAILRKRLIVEIGIADITLYRWREGKSVPALPYYRQGAARIVSETLGRAVSAEELFPTLK